MRAGGGRRGSGGQGGRRGRREPGEDRPGAADGAARFANARDAGHIFGRGFDKGVSAHAFTELETAEPRAAAAPLPTPEVSPMPRISLADPIADDLGELLAA